MELLKKFYMADSTGGGGNFNTDDANKGFSEMKNNLRGINAIFKEGINNSLDNMDEKTQTVVKSIGRDLTGAIKETEKLTKSLIQSTNDIGKSLNSEAKIREEISKTVERVRSISESLNELQSEGVDITAEMRRAQSDLVQVIADQNLLLQVRLQNVLLTNKAMGTYGKLVEGIAKIPIVGNLLDAKSILEKMKDTAAETGSKLATLGTGLKETFASIGQSLKDPFVIITGITVAFTKLVKLATDYQSKQFEAAKDLGVSVERGQQLRDSFVDIARSNLGLAVTADQLQKSYAGVQNELGIIVQQNDEFNLTSSLIERRTGASAANMAQLQFAAKGMNTTLAKAYTSIVGSAKAEGARVGAVMSERQILESISETTGTIYQNFNGNFKAIAAANIQAKALGTSLDKINATQDQFLDFESSIAKQFEAEVLTGKELNLTAARQFALNHDTKGLMLEINKLVGSSAEWNKLDTITQQSKAEALGLSRDAVNQMYMDQQKTALLGKDATADLQTQYNKLEEQHKTREEISQILGRDATQSAYTASVSEKMAATMDSIKLSIGQMAQGLMPLIKGFADLVGDADNLKTIFSGIVGIAGALVAISLTMKVAEAQLVVTQTQQLAILAAQNRLRLTGLTYLAEEIALQEGLAVAAVTAGSAAFGPGAIEIGLTTGAALALATGIALSGGGISSTPNTGITPYNPATATTGGTTGGTTSNAPIQPQTITIYNTMDGEVITKKVIQNTAATFGKSSN
jgi:type II secretory pathway pseudopilin PulG